MAQTETMSLSLFPWLGYAWDQSTRAYPLIVFRNAASEINKALLKYIDSVYCGEADESFDQKFIAWIRPICEKRFQDMQMEERNQEIQMEILI